MATSGSSALSRLAPGVLFSAGAAALALLLHSALPAVPWLTLSFLAGLALSWAATRLARTRGLRERAEPGIAWAGKKLMRFGVVLLGFVASLGDIARLGWLPIVATVLVVPASLAVTWALGRRMDRDERLLLATGFSICGASAISAMAAARGIDHRKTAIPTALVTLCGSLAIGLMPLLIALTHPSAPAAGAWIGASVHDVGQVVAAAQSSDALVAGAAGSVVALAVAVKMIRVVCLAPVTAVASRWGRRDSEGRGQAAPIVPLFVLGFVLALAARTWLPIPEGVLHGVGLLRDTALALALAALGASVDPQALWNRGRSALAAALAAWAAILVLGWLVAMSTTLSG
ncbi:YeiH family protein [Arthrobacter sp. UM1]|uniref:YeiH family protein n=1 Tax=Arthrobacter sp. UM1 TaxID=2766776 RepID=UPI001CF69767|nr:putative sulfate exporter family transporter [Arthrobacter sp. UM1]MCB4207483.1 putative sulfate exporter family transporter [Arthrobacter sp. UM1]